MIRRRRPTPRRREAPRWSAGEWESATETMWRRQRGRCPWCGDELRDSGERHHRKRRREGGDRYANLVILHPACHGYVHRNPTEGVLRGMIVPTWQDPLEVPVVEPTGVRWTYDDDGTALRVLD